MDLSNWSVPHPNENRYIPAIDYDEDGETHPWLSYLSALRPKGKQRYIAQKDKENSDDVAFELLLNYPFIEVEVDIPFGEIFKANEYMDGMSPLLRRCSEYADRVVDLLRLEQCKYSQHERLPGIAGQLLDGFHAAWVIPLSDAPFEPKLYCHFASPFQITPNWLGLDIIEGITAETNDLASLVFGTDANEMSKRLRSAVRTIGQTFYILTSEARFLSLVFSLDGLCAPKKNWVGLAHRAYIAAVSSGKDVYCFKYHLKMFTSAYEDIRNPIVHRGSSFIELGIDPDKASDNMLSILRGCIAGIAYSGVRTVEELQINTLEILRSPEFREVVLSFIDECNSTRSSGKPLRTPKW